MADAMLIVDPNLDFTDTDGRYLGQPGALCVPDAPEDMDNTAALVRAKKKTLQAIYVSLDSHHPFHIAHPAPWLNSAGEHPAPLTNISGEMMDDGTWRASLPRYQQRQREYLQKLEDNQRYPHTIWPPHCLIGTPGHAIWPPLYEALSEWALYHGTFVNWITKGSWPWSEHFSIMQADVPDPQDPSTGLNTSLINALAAVTQNPNSLLYVAGEAENFCVANTMYDTVDNFGNGATDQIVLLEDCMSPIGGVPELDALTDQFHDRMQQANVKTAKSTDLI